MPLVPEGSYNAIAEQWDLGESENGTECIAIQFRLLEGPVGTRRTYYGYFTEKTQRRTIEVMRICGWKGHDFLKLEGLDRNMVRVVIRHEDYKGNIRDRIAFVNKPSALMLKKPMKNSDRERFASQMKGMAMSIPEVDGTPPPQDVRTDDSYDNGSIGNDPFDKNGDSPPSYLDDLPPYTDDDEPF